MDNSPTLTERIVKGSTLVVLLTLLASPFGYLLRMLYSQTLSIESFGLFYAALALFTLVSTYNDLGFGYSVSYFLPKYIKEGDYKTSWLMYKYDQLIEVGTAAALSIILILTAPLLAQYYFKTSDATTLIYIFCIYLITNSFLSALNKAFNGLQQDSYYSSMQFVRTFFTLIFSILLWMFDQANIVYYALAWSAGYFFTSLIYNYLLYKMNPEVSGFILKWDRRIFNLMLSYAIPTLVTTTVSSFVIYIDTITLTIFRGVKEVGIYNIALPIVSISSIFLSPINNLLFPLVSHLMEEDKEKIKKLIEMILKLIPFAGLYFSLFFILFPSTPIALLFGSKWLGLVETPLTILAVAFIAAPLSSYLTTIVSGIGKVKERLRASVIIALSTLVFNLLLVSRFGIVGTAISNVLISLISVYFFGKIVQQVIPFKYPYRHYLEMFIIAIILITTSKLFPIIITSWSWYIFAGLTYSVIMFIFSYSLNILDKDSIKLIIKRKYEFK
ncbi:MAG: Polysaccharide biosynthesis protein [Candidatus Daviesbacteria bacterium GW2011_GWA2_38_24]|uniref:Polysaccharide biosynthesis protein n=1 Tax=Candidatus Daviesbacteria bacterium GW2011_GWA2_38_24 TaxID=1618422 RepID=A0A0G0MQM7_9BACT|nr:MAG: Polysaccharide biosynthesis protein [Candidatus Daviesbacteria bacterium GW2011_GWA2_38_24]KKQ81019.1 MAG: Polysaccharide biosynthesis protein [Candidatus Daviesbacteria bacterium GW2011_GWA1_38_7]OGE24356.1 MAG: hypothetical protein A2688_03870 [Candidatus Daviesbacteria bacterium RIFCSPHIGHO2_01_FULL_38_8]